MMQKLHVVYKQAGPQLMMKQKDEMNAIDKVKEEIMIHTKKKCCKFNFGKWISHQKLTLPEADEWSGICSLRNGPESERLRIEQ